MMKIISSQVRLTRARAKLTQVDVAERVGMAVRVYGRLERGKILPRVETLRKLSMALGASADELLMLEPVAVTPRAPSPPTPGDNPEIRRLLRRVIKLDRRSLSLLTVFAEAISDEPILPEPGSELQSGIRPQSGAGA